MTPLAREVLREAVAMMRADSHLTAAQAIRAVSIRADEAAYLAAFPDHGVPDRGASMAMMRRAIEAPE